MFVISWYVNWPINMMSRGKLMVQAVLESEIRKRTETDNAERNINTNELNSNSNNTENVDIIALSNTENFAANDPKTSALLLAEYNQAGPSNSLNQKKENENCDNELHFSEDDDDSVKDPDYDSSSSSCSNSTCSSDSSSSSSSAESSNAELVTRPLDDYPVIDQPIIPTEPESLIEKDAESTEPKKTRKRLRRGSKKEKNKILRNLGKEYKSSAKSQKLVPAKSVKPPCTDKCKYKCSTKISEEERLIIFNEYYSLIDINRKREFISRNMESIKPNYRYPQPNSRRLNNAFNLQINQKKIRVCKLFFMRTLDINARTIYTVLEKRTSSGSVSDDKRGKHGKHRSVDDDIKSGIRAHINSIPRKESHYLRAQTSKEFIEGGKTIADLHREYKLQCEEANKPYGNYHLYSDIFNTEFNISFYVPKKDQCNLCYIYDNADEDEKINLKLAYDKHQEQKTLSRLEKENDKKLCNNNFIVACYDMQAVFQVPKGDISVFYYRSKLNTMNLTVTGLAQDDTLSFVWHEGEAGKGVTEVGSCILLYLQQMAEKCQSDDLEITLYSDNCAAQQKNRFLIATLLYAVRKYQIKQITQKFLIIGHTQNEGDTTHSTIEKQVSRSLKSGPIFVPDQFIQLIRTAKKKGEPYRVRELTHDDFMNIKQLMNDLGSNFNVNSDGDQLVINDLRVVKVEKTEPFKYFYKTSYSDTQFKTVDILQKKRPNTKRQKGEQLQPPAPEIPVLKRAYARKRQLNEKKIEDLKFLLAKGYIPKYYRAFYETLWS